MKDLINKNYQSIVNRGLVTDETIESDFIRKLDEEVQEFIEAEWFDLPNRNEELADVILVCLCFAKHYDIDIESELINKVIKNENRANQATNL